MQVILFNQLCCLYHYCISVTNLQKKKRSAQIRTIWERVAKHFLSCDKIRYSTHHHHYTVTCTKPTKEQPPILPFRVPLLHSLLTLSPKQKYERKLRRKQRERERKEEKEHCKSGQHFHLFPSLLGVLSHLDNGEAKLSTPTDPLKPRRKREGIEGP